MEEPKISLSQTVYGKIVYWLSCVAAMICTIGPVMAVVHQDKNMINPHYLFFAIWEGKNPETLWTELGGGFQGGYFWLHHLATGDGFTQFGLVLGCSCAFVALTGAAIADLREKPPAYGWAILSAWVATLVILSALGIYHT